MKKYINFIFIFSILLLATISMLGCNTLGALFRGEDVNLDDVVGDIEEGSQFQKEYKALLRDIFQNQKNTTLVGLLVLLFLVIMNC
jgi:predicted small secreted protein